VQILQDEIDVHREPIRRVDVTGTYLKYLGSRADIAELGQQLMSIRLQWKRLVQRAGKIKQQLRQAYHETKRVKSAHSREVMAHAIVLMSHRVGLFNMC